MTNEITVKEGEQSSLRLQLTVPPRLLCPPQRRANNSCEVRVITTFMGKDSLCPNGNAMTQAVIGYK